MVQSPAKRVAEISQATERLDGLAGNLAGRLRAFDVGGTQHRSIQPQQIAISCDRKLAAD